MEWSSRLGSAAMECTLSTAKLPVEEVLHFLAILYKVCRSARMINTTMRLNSHDSRDASSTNLSQ